MDVCICRFRKEVGGGVVVKVYCFIGILGGIRRFYRSMDYLNMCNKRRGYFY